MHHLKFDIREKITLVEFPKMVNDKSLSNQFLVSLLPKREHINVCFLPFSGGSGYSSDENVIIYNNTQSKYNLR